MKVSLNFLHQQSNTWLRELKFYKEEITLLGERLGEVAQRNTDKEVMAQVEHFQNKLIMLNEQCDVVKHGVNLRNEAVMAKAKEKPEHLTEKSQTVVDELQSQMMDFTNSIADTRLEFNQFLSKVL